MNFIDIIIVALLISSVFRGREVGFVRQLLSTLGFFGGLFIGALLEPHTVHLVESPVARSVVTLLTTLGCAFLLLTVGEYIGIVLKTKFTLKRINAADNVLGSLLALATVLVGVWLSASIALSVPSASLQSAIKGSAIIANLSRKLPPAPTIVASLSHLIDPNGFPQVFTGNEPSPESNVPLPNLGDMQAAVQKDQVSVVKVEGQGCGGIVEGSGFVVGTNLIATNAHVVAGIQSPYVLDTNGTHSATPIWFDPNLDFAVLRVNHLAGKPLPINDSKITRGTPGAVLGYPGGGDFTANVAAVLDEFTATGRNIYNQGDITRDIYEVEADIIPGNSGGPLIGQDGSVFGVVFAESTTYNHVGYALNTGQVLSEIHQAQTKNHSVSTGSCAE
jgi:S1-C subfamily serine protease